MKDIKYKLIFITEDKIEYYGDASKGETHSEYLYKYIKKYHDSHPFLSKLTVYTGADSLAYALTYFNNMAIILNETKKDSKGNIKYGSFAGLILPTHTTEKLK